MTSSKWLQLDEKAQNILIKNDRGGFTVPTAGLYPYQWNWDSAFAAGVSRLLTLSAHGKN